MAESVGMAEIRGENFNRAVIGFALQEYKMKQICMIQTSSKWTETYFKETAAELSGAATRRIKGVSRLANFPYLEETWTPDSVRLLKFAGEGVISWEDIKTNEIDVMARTLIRISRAIAFAVDNYLYYTITNDADVNTLPAATEWDNATVADRDPIGDILHGIEYLDVDNYDALKNGYLLVSPADYTNLMMNSKVINNPTFKTADIVSNGVVSSICGLKIIKSNVVDADEACIIVGQTAMTWKTASPLTTKTIDDPGIKTTIRAWEIGAAYITNPQAIHIITNTQA